MTKLFKLLNYFDFEHFKQTGYPAIGLEYYAFDHGPVPKKLWLQVKDGVAPDDFKDKIALVVKQDEMNPARKEIVFKPKPKKEPDLSVFSPREIRILEGLAEIFRDTRGNLISEATHFHGQPWKITRDTKGRNAYIDYLLALDSEALVSREDAEESLREHFGVVRLFDIEPVK